MIEIDNLLDQPPYALRHGEKDDLFRRLLLDLTRHHARHCEPYRRIVDLMGFDLTRQQDVTTYPFLPTRLFKTHKLQSISDDEIRTVLTSSGTSGQNVSRIALDGSAAHRQSRALSLIVSDFIGPHRLPMLIIDAPGTVRRGGQFPARAAGILGFSLFGRHAVYALNDDMTLNLDAIEAFAAKQTGSAILIFGFTFMIFEYLIKALEDMRHRIDLDKAVLIHGGGWKKLFDSAISADSFKDRLRGTTGVRQVHNYYGVVEQTGSIFMECEHGHLHCSDLSHVIVRDHQFRPVLHRQRGIVQLISLLPHSYPGHSILTEDEGTILGEDDCPCGRAGRYFTIHGRLAEAEIRGCSDAYAA